MINPMALQLKALLVTLVVSVRSIEVAAPVWPNCSELPQRPVPEHVRDLRIDDFKVIMAMGDSMTGGFNSVKPDMKVHISLGVPQG